MWGKLRDFVSNYYFVNTAAISTTSYNQKQSDADARNGYVIMVPKNRRTSISVIPQHQTFRLDDSSQRKGIARVRSIRGKRRTKVPDISIPGLCKLFDPTYNRWGKFFWGLAITSSIVFCIYQLTDRYFHYMKHPVNVDIALSRNQTITFPAITLCPTNLHFDMEAAHMKNRAEALCKELNCSGLDLTPIDRRQWPVDQLWKIWGMSSSQVSLKTPCSSVIHTANETVKPSKCKDGYVDFDVDFEEMYTVWGICIVLKPVSRMEYRGPDTYIKVWYNDSVLQQVMTSERRTIDEERIGKHSIEFFFHAPEIFHRHDAKFLAEPIFKGSYTTIRFGMKEFNFLDSRDHPCEDAKIVAECRTDCIDRLMEERLECCLPFVKCKRLKNCTTLYHARRAHAAAEEVYINLTVTDCKCKRSCKEVVYSLTTSVVEKLGNHINVTAMQFYYPDNFYEITYENYSYSLSSFFSDIAANLGFFLGFCALTLIEMFEAIVTQANELRQQRSRKTLSAYSVKSHN